MRSRTLVYVMMLVIVWLTVLHWSLEAYALRSTFRATLFTAAMVYIMGRFTLSYIRETWPMWSHQTAARVWSWALVVRDTPKNRARCVWHLQWLMREDDKAIAAFIGSRGRRPASRTMVPSPRGPAN